MEVTLERPLVDLYMLARDPAYTSLKPNSKEPKGNAWQKIPLSAEQVQAALVFMSQFPNLLKIKEILYWPKWCMPHRGAFAPKRVTYRYTKPVSHDQLC